MYTYIRNDLDNQQKDFFGSSDLLTQHFRDSPAFDKPVLTKVDEMGIANEHFLVKCVPKYGQSVPKSKLDLSTVEIGGEEYPTNRNTRQDGNRPSRRTENASQNLPSLSPTPDRVTVEPPSRQRSKIGSYAQRPELDQSQTQTQASAGISRKDAMNHLQLYQREYIQQLGNKCINTWYPPLRLEDTTLLSTNPNLKRFNDLKKRLNNQMMGEDGEKPAVVMHSPQ